jgi:1-pyrroline-5-carboxylate dehydrogenase
LTVHLTYTTGSLGKEIDDSFERSLASLREAEAELHPHLIGGDWISGTGRLERRDPARTQAVVSLAPEGTSEDVARAIASARAALPGWRKLPFEARAQALRAVAAAIGERHIELAAIVSLETGKTRTESIAEVQEGIDLIETYADFVEQNGGWTRPLQSLQDDEINIDVLRPYGVFGVICPFNFPFALTIGMSAAALLAGNTVVVKPSEETLSTGHAFAELMAGAGLEAGVFNLVQGGPDTGRLLVDSDVDGIAFTGSAEVGREIARKLQDGPYARPALMEMGGKNPAIVMASADLDAAAEGVARAAFGLSGQKCSACSRVVVAEEVHDEFVDRLVAFTAPLQLGDASDPAAFLGPVINETSAKRFEDAAAAAGQEGRVAVGGTRPDLPGWFVEPTVVTGLPRGHDLTRRELFLPFVTVTPAAGFDDALEEANATRYGLTAGIFTGDDSEKERFLDEIEAGIVYVNRRAGATTGAWPGAQTFCGWKSSGATGKGGLGAWYVPQFMREQSRTIVG